MRTRIPRTSRGCGRRDRPLRRVRRRSPAWKSDPDQRLYIQQDANLNVTSVVGYDGLDWVVKQRYVYDPYGAQTVLSPTWSSTTDAYGLLFGFQGGRLDPSTGLYNFQRRDYDPTLGRWIEQDPAHYIDGPNMYQMEGSSPVNRVDPTGLDSSTYIQIAPLVWIPQPPPPPPAPPGGHGHGPTTCPVPPNQMGMAKGRRYRQKDGDAEDRFRGIQKRQADQRSGTEGDQRNNRAIESTDKSEQRADYEAQQAAKDAADKMNQAARRAAECETAEEEEFIGIGIGGLVIGLMLL